MDSQTTAASVAPISPADRIASSVAPSLLQRVLLFPLKLFWGMIFCQSLAGSIFVVGWTYRLAQRSAFKLWFSRSPLSHRQTSLIEFLASSDATRAQVHWPNWFARQSFREAARAQSERKSGYAFALAQGLVHSLWLNFWIGLRGIANTCVLTLPPCLLWWFGWYDGWNNSFNKGYEQAAIGPLISLIGIAWFIMAMLYLPLAQARQAVSGDWRAFFQFRLIRKLVRHRRVDCVLLAASYSLLSVPLSILKTSPMFWMHNSHALGTLTSAQVIAALNPYFFWCALVLLPSFVILHLFAARIYASGLLVLLQNGTIARSELSAAEQDVLDRLELLKVSPQPERHIFVRWVAWTGTRLGRIAGAVILVLIWFSFVAQIYISEFVNYHAVLGWINQPLIQLPWFRYLPMSVRNPLADLSSALLILLAALLIRSIARTFRKPRES